jgi:hypothetical protein
MEVETLFPIASELCKFQKLVSAASWRILSRIRIPSYAQFVKKAEVVV